VRGGSASSRSVNELAVDSERRRLVLFSPMGRDSLHPVHASRADTLPSRFASLSGLLPPSAENGSSALASTQTRPFHSAGIAGSDRTLRGVRRRTPASQKGRTPCRRGDGTISLFAGFGGARGEASGICTLELTEEGPLAARI